MVKQEIVVNNQSGLHARPANEFVKMAAHYPCKVTLAKGSKNYNGKSIVSVLSACVKCGSSIEIVCDGEQEEDALRDLVQAVKSGLGE